MPGPTRPGGRPTRLVARDRDSDRDVTNDVPTLTAVCDALPQRPNEKTPHKAANARWAGAAWPLRRTQTRACERRAGRACRARPQPRRPQPRGGTLGPGARGEPKDISNE